MVAIVVIAFIYEFLSKLHQIEPHERTNGACKAAYNQTLAQYHPWIVRQGTSNVNGRHLNNKKDQSSTQHLIIETVCFRD